MDKAKVIVDPNLNTLRFYSSKVSLDVEFKNLFLKYLISTQYCFKLRKSKEFIFFYENIQNLKFYDQPDYDFLRK